MMTNSPGPLLNLQSRLRCCYWLLAKALSGMGLLVPAFFY